MEWSTAGGLGREREGSYVKTHTKRWELSRDIAAQLSSGLCSYTEWEGRKDGQADFLLQSKYEIWQKGEKKGKEASPLHIVVGEGRRKVSTALCWLTKKE